MKKQWLLSTCVIISAFLLIAFRPLQNKEIAIGDQTWSSANLDVAAFQNGDVIPQMKTDMEWLMADAQKKPAWCYFEFNDKNAAAGKLYNGHAMTDSRGLAPKGWKIPTDEDWKVLEEFIGKNANQITAGLSNETGFSAKLAGTVNASGLSMESSYAYWTSTSVTKISSFARIVYEGSNVINRKVRRMGDGAYIRLIKD